MEMVWIPPGDFMMGSDAGNDEKPVHKGTITQPLYMGRYEVAQEQWKNEGEESKPLQGVGVAGKKW